MAQIKVYKNSEEQARAFADYMNDMEWHTRRELLDELAIPIKKMESWLKHIPIETTMGIGETKYIKYGETYTSTYKVKKYRAKEKIEIIILNKTRKKTNKTNKTNDKKNTVESSSPMLTKWMPVIKEKIGDKKVIKKNELVDIGIEINFNESVKKLIVIAEEMGVRVA